MLSVTPLAPPRAWLSRRDPVAKLGAAAVLSLAALVATDPLTPALLLGVQLAALPLGGVRMGAFLRRARLIAVAAAGLAVVNTVFAADQSGPLVLHIGPLRVHEAALWTGLALGLRALTFAVAGIIVFATTDPTDLADALVQHLRVPARFAIGALAAFRMMPLLAAEWRLITMARRARGVDAGRWNVPARLRLFASVVFALLVGAIRRGTRLATAMDARGFDSGTPRTVARPQRMDAADRVLLAAAVAVAVAAVAISAATGMYRGLF